MLTVRASSVKAYNRCPRLWRAQYIDGLRSPDTGATARGTALHRIQELWLRDGIAPHDTPRVHPQHDALVELAHKGHEYLPAPGTCRVEDKWTLPLIDGAVAHGTIDCWDGSSHIWDHKTTSNIVKWALTKRTLPHDAQAIMYAWRALQAGAQGPIALRWVYYQSSPARVVPVDATLSRDQIMARMRDIILVAQAMLRDSARYADWLDTPARVGDEACYRYNGCHLLPYCMRAKEALL